SQFRAVQVFAPQTIPPAIEFTGDTNRNCVLVAIENVHTSVGNRPTDRDCRCSVADAFDAMPRSECCVLSGSIHIEKMLRRAVLEYFPDPLWITRIASNQEIPQMLERGRHLAGQSIEQRRRQDKRSDLLFLDLRKNPSGR